MMLGTQRADSYVFIYEDLPLASAFPTTNAPVQGALLTNLKHRALAAEANEEVEQATATIQSLRAHRNQLQEALT